MTCKKQFPTPCVYRKYNGLVCILENEARDITAQDCMDCPLSLEERMNEKRISDRRKIIKDRRFEGARKPDRRKTERRKKGL